MNTQPKWMTVVGWVLTLLVVGMLSFSAFMKFTAPPEMKDAFVNVMGYPAKSLLIIGCVEAFCAVIFLIPQLAVVGAILLTAYLGGAVATHVRISDHFFGPIIGGVLVWLALYFRDARVRELAPLKKVFLVLLLAIAGLPGLVALQPAESHVERSLTMSAPPAAIFEQINDFHKWEAWSPWAKLDPNATVTFKGPESGKDAHMEWAGNSDVGKGSMTILESKPNELIRIKLEFKEPFAGVSTTEFQLKPEGDKTLVTWSMHGKNDYMSKAFCLLMNMDKEIGQQYDKGLANIKKIVEKAPAK